MADKFKTGDVVVLKSGSPKMTITGYHHGFYADRPDTDTYDTVWFKGDETESGTFHEDVLELAEDKNAE